MARSFVLLAFLASLACAQDREGCPHELQAAAEDAGSHAIFDALLRSFVIDGVVDYRCFKQHEAELDRYLAQLDATNPENLLRDAKVAFWINAYNACTIKLILESYPDIESIRDLSRPWKREAWSIGGKLYSLDQMENAILRKYDPRIHFAIVCASFSCPDLQAEAFVGSRLDAQLEAATRAFVADEAKGFRAASEPGALWGTNHNVYFSSIFNWYEADFSAGLVEFVKPYLPEAARAFVDEHGEELSIRFMDYDWSLNGQ